MPVPARISNHLEQATERLISQFRSHRPVLHGLLQAYIDPLQFLENTLWDVIHFRLLDPAPGETHGAEGVQLDVLGRIVGQPRLGMADGAFREAIRLRIRVNRSRGSAVDLLEILRLAMPAPKVFAYTEEYYLASITFVEGISAALAITLLGALNSARAAGYRAILIYSTDRVDQSRLFRWANDTTGGNGGFGNEGDATSGGLLYSMQG